MNPFLPHHNQGFPQFQPQYQQQNFQAAAARPAYPVSNPLQGWTPGYVMPGFPLQFQTGHVGYQVPMQQQQASQATVQTTDSKAPPLPKSNPPKEVAPLPPPPDDIPRAPVPPPPEDEPSGIGGWQGGRSSNELISQSFKSNLGMGIADANEGEQKSMNVNYKKAISSLAVSKQLANTNDDLSILNKQLLQLETQMKKYQSEYEKWFKEFSAWRKQHENHPDQKQYIEYQQKYQKMIEQQQQALKEQYIELQNRIKVKKMGGMDIEVEKQHSKPVTYISNHQTESSIVGQNTSIRQAVVNNAQISMSRSNLIPHSQGNVQGTPMSNFAPGFQRQVNVSYTHTDTSMQGAVNQSQAGISESAYRKPFPQQSYQSLPRAEPITSSQQMQNDFANRVPSGTVQNQYQARYQEMEGTQENNQKYPNQMQQNQLEAGNIPRFHHPRFDVRPQNTQLSSSSGHHPQQLRGQSPRMANQQSPSQTPFGNQPREQVVPQTEHQFSHVRHTGPRPIRPGSQSLQNRFQEPRFQNRAQARPVRPQQPRFASQANQPNQSQFQPNSNLPESPRNTRMPIPSSLQKQSPFAANNRAQTSANTPSRIPSLMSQDIPKKFYYDDAIEDGANKKAGNLQMQTEQNDQSYRPNQSTGMYQEFENNKNTNRNAAGEDFTSDDVSTFEWEAEAEAGVLPNQPPLSPKSIITRSQSLPDSEPVTVSNQRFQTPPQGVNRNQPRLMTPGRGVSQRPQFAPRLSAPSNSAPRMGHSSQPRPPFGHGQVRPPLTPKQFVRPIRAVVSKPSSIQDINTAPKADQPNEKVSEEKPNTSQASDSSDFINEKSGASINERNAPLQVSAPAGMRRSSAPFSQQGKPSTPQDSIRKNEMDGQGAQMRGASGLVPIRLPSLVHQQANPNKTVKRYNCKFFPTCKFGKDCNYKHPICPKSLYCENVSCNYEHLQLSKEKIDDIQQKMREQRTVRLDQDSRKTLGNPSYRSAIGKPVQNLSNVNREKSQHEGNAAFPVPRNSKENPVLEENTGGYGNSHYEGPGRTSANAFHMDDYGQRSGFDESYAEKQFPSKDFDQREQGMFNELNAARRLSRDVAEHNQGEREPPKDERPFSNDVDMTDENNGGQDVASFQANRDSTGIPSVPDQLKSEPIRKPEDGTSHNEIRGPSANRFPTGHSQFEDGMEPPGGETGLQKDGHQMPAGERPPGYMGGLHGRELERFPTKDQHFREDYERLPPRDDPERLSFRDEPYKYPGESPGFGAGEDELRTRDERGLYPKEYARRPSPPRWDSFRDQFEFERRYRHWEKQHFPIDDPTREWEYELRRRELLGAIAPPPPRYRGSDYPPRDFYPRDTYDRPVRPRDPFDVIQEERYHPDDRLHPRDPYLSRGREAFRPAIFDYDHSRKVDVFDGSVGKEVDSVGRPASPRPLSPTQLSPRRLSQREASLRGLSPGRVSPSPRILSPPRTKPRSPSPGSRRGDKSRSPERMRSSSARRSRSPIRSRSPNRSPRRGRRSRSPRRRSRSPGSRTKSPPTRRSSSRRSPSPRRRNRSPPSDLLRHSRDRPAHDLSFPRDSYDRDRYGTPLSKESSRGVTDRRDARPLFEEPYYSRMEEVKQPVEVKPPEPAPETVAVNDLLDPPARESRPKQIVIILRGLPGCGKTHIAKIIKDKEVSYGSPAPRILALDDYFIQENDVYQKDPDTGKKVKVKKMEYVYEKEMEAAYRVSLLKSFNKTLDNGYFPMVIIDAVNDKVESFQKFWSDGKHKGFEVYIAEMHGDVQECAEKNIHNWTQESIQKISDNWEQTPNHFKRLDVRSLVQDAAIKEVEMEEVEQPAAEADSKKENDDDDDIDEEDLGTFHIPKKSKWEETKDEQLAKLDGIRHDKNKKKKSVLHNDDDDDDDVYDDDPYDEREEDMRIGKKRVRWADIEERKQLEHRKRIGFCIGTDWSVLTDPNAQVPL